MQGHERVRIARLRVLHRHVFRVGHDGERVVGGVVHREGVLVHRGLVEREEGKLRRVGGPPERGVGAEDFFFVYPVGYTVEKRLRACSC